MARRILMALVLFSVVALPAGDAPAPQTFETPEAAWKAFIDTLKGGDWKALEALIGPASSFVPPKDRETEALKKAGEEMEKEEMKVEVKEDTATFMVHGRPFPFTAKKTDKGWVLGGDTKALEEQAATKQRMACSIRLKVISSGVSAYTAKEKKAPPSLEALTKGPEADRYLQATALLCPAVEEGKHAAGAEGISCDYVYIPPKEGAKGDTLIVFCPKANHPTGNRAALSLDGTVMIFGEGADFLPAADLPKKIKEAVEAAGIPLEAPKEGEPALPEGSPAKNPEWLKAVRTELGLEVPAGDKPPEAKPPEGDKPPEAKPPAEKPKKTGGKKGGKKKKKGGEAPAPPPEAAPKAD